MANISTSFKASSTNTVTTSVVVSLPGSLIPTNTISLSSANVSTTGISLTSTTYSLTSASSHINTNSSIQNVSCTSQNSSLNPGNTTTPSFSMSGNSTSTAIPSTSSSSFGHNTSNILCSSISNLTINSSNTSIATTSVSSIPTFSAGNMAPTTTICAATTSLLPNTIASSTISICSTSSVHVSSARGVTSTPSFTTASTSHVPGTSLVNTSRTSSKYDTRDDHVEYARICRAINDLGRDILIDLLERHIRPKNLPNVVRMKKCLLPRLNKEQMKLINNTPVDKYSKLDVSLLCVFLSNLCPIPAPTSTWHTDVMPNISETSPGDDIKRIRLLRNKMYGHVADTSEAGRGSSLVWTELNGICKRMDAAYGTDYLVSLMDLQITDMDSIAARKYDSSLRCVKRKKKKKKQKLLRIELIRRGESVLRDHRKKDIIKRQKLERACLKALDGGNILLITGKVGSGKSTLSSEIIYQFKEKSDVDVYVLEEADEWSDVNITDDNEILILIDDFCNSTISKNNAIENWRGLIDEIVSGARDKNARIIININFNILNSIQHDLSKILTRSRSFNISDNNWSLTDLEKETFFNKMLSKSMHFISREEKKKICASKPVMGFFNACLAFFEYSENFNQGSEYFKTLEKDYSVSIEIMISKDVPKYAVFLCLLLNETNDGNMVDLKILDEICLSFNSPPQTHDIVNEQMKSLLRMSLIQKCEGRDTYRFSNTQVHWSLLQSVGRIKSSVLIELGTPTFIFNRLRSTRYKPHPGEICLCMRSEEEDVLATKLLSLFDRGRILNDLNDMCLEHKSCSDKYFLSMLFGKMKDKFKDEKNETYFNDILDWSCLNAYDNISDITLTTLDELNMITPYTIERAMKMLALSEKPCHSTVLTLAKCKQFTHISTECCFDVIKRAETLELDFKTVSRIIDVMKLSDRELTDFITDSIDSAISMQIKKVIIELSSRVSHNELVRIIFRCVDNKLHNEEDILLVLLDLTSNLNQLSERNKVFEEMINKIFESHVQLSTCITVIHRWMDCQPDVGSSTIRDLIFLKPMNKSWYEEYLHKKIIQSILKKLKKADLAYILHVSFSQNVRKECVEIFLHNAKTNFDSNEVTNLLTDSIDMDSNFSQNLCICSNSALLMKNFDKEVVRLIKRCVELFINRPFVREQKIVVLLILASSSNLSLNRFSFLLDRIIEDFEDDRYFTLFELLFEIHGTSLSCVHLKNLSRCIIDVHSKFRDAFMKYIENRRKLKKIPPAIGEHLATITLQRYEVPLLLGRMHLVSDKDFRSAIISTLLESCYHHVEMGEHLLPDIFSFLSSDIFTINSGALFIGIVATVDTYTDDRKSKVFEFIRSLLQCNSLKKDVFQCILMKLVDSNILCEMSYDDGKLLLVKTVKTTKRSITRQSIFNILQHACTSKFKDKKLLALLIRNSNIQNMDERKLLLILHKAVRYRSYTIVHGLFQIGSLERICEYTYAHPSRNSCDTMHTCFLMLTSSLVSYYDIPKSLKSLWTRFLNSQTELYNVDDFLKETINTYSLTRKKVRLFLRCVIKFRCVDSFDYWEMIETIKAKSTGSIQIDKISLFQFLEDIDKSYDHDMSLLCALIIFDLIPHDTEVLVVVFKTFLDQIKYDDYLDDMHRNCLEILSTHMFNASFNRPDAFTLTASFLTTSLHYETPEFVCSFLRNSVFPHLDSADILNIMDMENFRYSICLKEFLSYVLTTYAGEDMYKKDELQISAAEGCSSLCEAHVKMSTIEHLEISSEQTTQSNQSIIKCDSKRLVSVFEKRLISLRGYDAYDDDEEVTVYDIKELILKVLFTIRCYEVDPLDGCNIIKQLFSYADRRRKNKFPRTMQGFLRSTILPSLDVPRQVDVLDLCLDNPLNNDISDAFATYLQDMNGHQYLSVFIEYLRNVSMFHLDRIAMFVNLRGHLGSYAEKALVYHICRCLTDENYEQLDKHQFRLPPIKLLNILLVLRLKREKYLESNLRYEIQIKPQDYISGSIPFTMEEMINDQPVVEAKVKKSDLSVSLDVKFRRFNANAVLFDEPRLSSDHFAVLLLSSYACSETNHIEEGMIDIFVKVHRYYEVFTVGVRGSVHSLVNTRVIDVILLYLMYPILSNREDMLDCFKERFRCHEQRWNELIGKDKQDFVCSLEQMLAYLDKCNIAAISASFVGDPFLDSQLSRKEYSIYYICLSILNMICDRQQVFSCFMCIIEQLEFDNDFIKDVFSIYHLRYLSGSETAFCLNAMVSKNWYHSIKLHRFVPCLLTNSPVSQYSAEDRRDFLTSFINKWKVNEQQKGFGKYRLMIVLTEKSIQKMIEREISSKKQILSSDCVDDYLRACVHYGEWDCFNLFIQHRNVTSTVLKNTVSLLVESMNHKNNSKDLVYSLVEGFKKKDNFKEKLSALLVTTESSKKINLDREDVLDVVLELAESDIPTKFKLIESIVSTQIQSQNNAYILNLIVDYFPICENCEDGMKVIDMDINHPTSLIFLSHLLTKLMPSDGRIFIPWDDKYEPVDCQLRSVQTNAALVNVSSHTDCSGNGQYEMSSSIQVGHSEDGVFDILLPFLTSEYDFNGLLCFLLHYLQIQFSGHCWTNILSSVIRQSIDVICNKDMLSEIDQVEPNTRSLKCIFETKHGQLEIDQQHFECLLKETIRSYVDSSSMMTVLFDHFSNIKLQEVALVNLCRVAITTRYVRSADYVEKFIAEATSCEFSEASTAMLVRHCLESPDNQSRTLRVILSYCPDEEIKKSVLNSELLSSLLSNRVKNPFNLDVILHNHELLHDNTIIMSLITSASNQISVSRVLSRIRKIPIDKCKDTDKVFVKLLTLYFTRYRYHHRHVCKTEACRLPDVNEFVDKVVLYYEDMGFLEIEFRFRLSTIDITYSLVDVIINTRCKNRRLLSWSFKDGNISYCPSKIINMSLKAIETEECVNSIVLILYETTEIVKFSDEELQMLFCAMINRKYAGREDYIHSLLSSPMYCGISEKSATGILRTATCKQRNNIAIIDLFIEEAERYDVHLSDPNMKLIISDLCECRHKRTVFYLRKLLQSTITPDGLSDDVFIAALTSYLRVKGECSEILSFLKEYKNDVSENFRCLLEKLKSNTQQKSDPDDEDDENEDDDDSIKSYIKGEIEWKTKIIDDIITSYFSMETDQ